MATLRYEGCAHFRARIIAATLSGRPIRIDKIRSENFDAPGLQDFEASFLRLIDKISDGAIDFGSSYLNFNDLCVSF